jgi:hypothetical protein
VFYAVLLLRILLSILLFIILLLIRKTRVSEAFGFATSDAPDQPQEPISEALPRWDSPSDDEKSTLAETIGELVLATNPPTLNLDGRQKLNIRLLSRQLHVSRKPMTAEAIYDLWPKGLNQSGVVNNTITDPVERGRVFRAGFRPTIHDIQSYQSTSSYIESMGSLGIEVDPSDTGLTIEQLGLLTILSNPADGRDLKRKLAHSGITWNKYQVWLSQPVFSQAHKETMDNLLKDMMPIAKQQMAAKIAAGDAAMIKFGMEVTGEHDPNSKKQIDAKAFIGILLEIIEEEVKDPSILQRIGAKISLRGAKTLEP